MEVGSSDIYILLSSVIYEMCYCLPFEASEDYKYLIQVICRGFKSPALPYSNQVYLLHVEQ